MRYALISILILCLCSCKDQTSKGSIGNNIMNANDSTNLDYTIVFASCNDQNKPQPLWEPILETNPDLFIWGGDNIYADSDDMTKMKSDYDKIMSHPSYAQLRNKTKIIGTWDDHDYGKNDAGHEWDMKTEAKDLALYFFDAAEDDVRRTRPGIYYSERIVTAEGIIKIILLDTRTFRDPLNESTDPDRRYDPWVGDEGGTILGEAQWSWLEDELKDDEADFTAIVSSIQFLSNKHGWEKWGNHPSEVDRLYEMLEQAKAKNIFILSGDRHLGEISINEKVGLNYPLVDFTSSGMTTTYIKEATEANPYRISNIIKRFNFGVLMFDFENNSVTFQLRGLDNFIFEEHVQTY